MLDTRQFLLTKLAEECNEVAQRALKQQQFGRDEVQPGQDKTNGQRLYEEIVDFYTVFLMLAEIGEVSGATGSKIEEQMIESKRLKLLKYRQYSQTLHMVEPETCTRCGIGSDQDGNCAVCHKLPDSHAADIKATR